MYARNQILSNLNMVVNFRSFFVDSLLKECTSVGISIEGKVLLAKNRDRTYYPKVRVVRDLINGMEVVYMYDEDSDYSEGMNAAGIGIVNTTLQGKKDENEGNDKLRKNRRKINEDGFRIRKALSYADPKTVVKSLDLFNRGLGGHTTVGHPNGFFSIEKLSFGRPVIKKYGRGSVIVRANHGIAYPDQGYQFGKDRESSLARSFYATKEARNAKTPAELLDFMRKHHDDVPGYQEPYRTNYKVWTSSQIMLNLSDLEFTFVVDENADFTGVENRLPKTYTPKIKVNIQKIETIFRIQSSVEG